MMKCPRGTSEQINANLTYLEYLEGRFRINSREEDDGHPEFEELTCQEEDGYLSIPELDISRADSRNPPGVEDEIVYLFVNHFLDILLKWWDGTPCLKPKLTKPAEVSISKHVHALDTQASDVTEGDPNDLQNTRSQKVLQDNQREGETLSAICRERCESRNSRTMNEDDESSAYSWKAFVPDEDVYMGFPNGVWYSGRVSRRLMDGEGTLFWEDGASFKGEFIAGSATGFGRLEFADLSIYEGGVYKGFRHGKGLHCMHESPVMYSGEWWLGKKYGHGVLFYSDPNRVPNFYKGSWVNGKQDGFGCRQYPSGARYLGSWKNGKRHGMGIMFWSNKDIYQGEWKNGLMEGFGEYVWNGFFNKTFSCPRANTYRGYWKNGERNGVGLLELANSAAIETIWSDNKKNGPGATVCPNGAIITSNKNLFKDDKPGILNGEDENLLGKLFRNTGFHSNRRKSSKKEAGKMLDQRQLLAYVKSMEKANAISIPVHTPVHSLDLSCHGRRLKEQKDEITQKQNPQISIFGWLNTPRMETCDKETALADNGPKQSDEVFSAEEKLLRYCVMVNLKRLQNCYDEWSTIACSTQPPFKCILLRIFFWELLTVADIPTRNFSLIDIDNILAAEGSFLIDSPHDPFEKIQLWQFIHYLITISWHLYGRYVYAEEDSGPSKELKHFLEEFRNRKEESVLSSSFNYFLRYHIFADHVKTARSSIKNWDLLPLEAMYLSYKSIGEPHSAKQFLVHQYQMSDSRTGNAPYIARIPASLQPGKNVIGITSKVSYVTAEEPFNDPQMSMLLNEEKEKTEKNFLDNLKAKDIIRCLIEACPNIMEGGLIVDIEYQLTFLEYYKAITYCAEMSLKKKKLKQIQSEILSNYQKEMEEYERQMKEYEKRKELMTSAPKKLLISKKSKKPL